MNVKDKKYIEDMITKAYAAGMESSSKLVMELSKKMNNIQNSPNRSEDHDAFIALVGSFNDLKENVNQKFTEVRSDIKEIKDGISARVESLEKIKVNRADLDLIQKKLDDNIEVRVRSMENDRVTQREHNVVIDCLAELKNNQTKIYAYASVIALVVSLVASFIGYFIEK